MGKYNIHKTANLKFARYGGLSSVNQRGYHAVPPTFHTPPATRGFYAFVWPFIELFLLGADCTKDPKTIGAKFKYVRDNKGVIITNLHPDYEAYSKHEKYWSVNSKEYEEFCDKNDRLDWKEFDALLETFKAPRYSLVEKPKPRIFEYNGPLWHHLGRHLKPHLILATKGDWVKTDMSSYRIALEKEMHGAHKEMMGWCYKAASEKYKIIPTKQAALRRGSKDHLEVFFERI
jgi:hypothetical protein